MSVPKFKVGQKVSIIKNTNTRSCGVRRDCPHKGDIKKIVDVKQHRWGFSYKLKLAKKQYCCYRETELKALENAIDFIMN